MHIARTGCHDLVHVLHHDHPLRDVQHVRERNSVKIEIVHLNKSNDMKENPRILIVSLFNFLTISCFVVSRTLDFLVEKYPNFDQGMDFLIF